MCWKDPRADRTPPPPPRTLESLRVPVGSLGGDEEVLEERLEVLERGSLLRAPLPAREHDVIQRVRYLKKEGTIGYRKHDVACWVPAKKGTAVHSRVRSG